MGALLPLLLPFFQSILTKMFPDPVEQAQAQAQLQAALNQATALELDAQAKMQESVGSIANTRAGSSSLFVSWCTPLLMYVFTAIIALNYLLAPLLGTCHIIIPTLVVPSNMWDLIMVFSGVYGLGSSGTKIAEHFSNKKFYDAYKSKFGTSLSQATVSKLNDVIKAAEADI